MKNYFLIVVLTFGLSLVALGQSKSNETPQPDRWRGLVLDEATPDDAIKIFGKSKKDKTESLPVAGVRIWLTKTIKEKKFRMMAFKNVGGVGSAVLGFLDNKLVFVVFETKDLSPNSLSRAYGIEFTPNFEGFDLALKPGDFERNQGKIYPKQYPGTYDLIGVSPKTFLVAGVGNTSMGSALKNAIGINDSTLGFPGKVYYVQIISRTLENRDNIDQLK